MKSTNRTAQRFARLALGCLIVFLIAVIILIKPVDGLSRFNRIALDLAACSFCAMFLLATIAFVLHGNASIMQYRTQVAHGAACEKINDAHWCVGIFGSITGLLLILLGWSDVMDMVQNHFLALCSILLLVVGFQSYIFWRWKWRLIQNLDEMQKMAQTHDAWLAELNKLREMLVNTSNTHNSH